MEGRRWVGGGEAERASFEGYQSHLCPPAILSALLQPDKGAG